MADGVVHLPPADPSTGAKQDTGNGSLATVAGAVGAHDVALPAGVVVEAGIGQTAAPTAVTPGRAVRAWRTLAGAAMAQLLGRDGATLASASNGVPVSPETSSVWDIADRAARLLGALTGVNGTSIATAANPVPVGLSTVDAAKVPALGQALAAASTPVVLTAIQIAQLAQTGQLPAALGINIQDGAILQVPAAMAVVSGASLATTGVLLKSGPGIVGYGNFTNSTGGAVYWQFHNTTSTPSAAARPLEAAAATVASGATVKIYPGNGVPGLPCDTGIFLILSSTQWTYTAIASTNAIYAFTVY